MSNFIRSIANCCAPCKDPQTVNIPGPQGDAGADGSDGLDGLNAFTTVTDVGAPVQPAVGADVQIEVGSTLWMIPDMRIFIGPDPGSAMGFYTVVSIDSDTLVTITNLGYSTNAAPGTVFAPGMKVSPAGLKGQDAASTGVSDTQNISSGVSSQAFVAPLGNFGFVPNVLICTVHKPPGGMNIFATVHSIAATGFTADFSGVIPAVGYSVEYLALP